MAEPATKAEWRLRLLAARRAVPAEVRVAEAAALAAHAVAAATAVSGPVCAYLPIGAEPGAGAGGGIGGSMLLDALTAAGHEVLLPVLPAIPGQLDWARYTGPDGLVPAPLGLRQPAGRRLGHPAVARAGLVLVPALAVDHRGIRLGRGGGYYDRTLPQVRPGTLVAAVVRDPELVARLPADRHDVPVNAALTPGHGRLALPR